MVRCLSFCRRIDVVLPDFSRPLLGSVLHYPLPTSVRTMRRAERAPFPIRRRCRPRARVSAGLIPAAHRHRSRRDDGTGAGSGRAPPPIQARWRRRRWFRPRRHRSRRGGRGLAHYRRHRNGVGFRPRGSYFGAIPRAFA